MHVSCQDAAYTIARDYTRTIKQAHVHAHTCTLSDLWAIEAWTRVAAPALASLQVIYRVRVNRTRAAFLCFNGRVDKEIALGARFQIENSIDGSPCSS